MAVVLFAPSSAGGAIHLAEHDSKSLLVGTKSGGDAAAGTALQALRKVMSRLSSCLIMISTSQPACPSGDTTLWTLMLTMQPMQHSCATAFLRT
jgi:hypothetical protein